MEHSSLLQCEADCYASADSPAVAEEWLGGPEHTALLCFLQEELGKDAPRPTPSDTTGHHRVTQNGKQLGTTEDLASYEEPTQPLTTAVMNNEDWGE